LQTATHVLVMGSEYNPTEQVNTQILVPSICYSP